MRQQTGAMEVEFDMEKLLEGVVCSCEEKRVILFEDVRPFERKLDVVAAEQQFKEIGLIADEGKLVGDDKLEYVALIVLVSVVGGPGVGGCDISE